MNHEADRQAQRLFELSLDLLIVIDRDMRVVRVNPSWERVLGRPADTLIGTRLMDIVHPADRESTMREAAGVAEHGVSAEFDNRYRHADGSYRWLRWSSVAGGGDGLIYGAARDVTGARAIHEELRRAVQRLERAQRVARMGSFEFDLRTGERFYTRELYIMYGLDPTTDAPLSTSGLLEHVVAEDRDRVQRAVDAATRSGGPAGADFRMAHAPDRVLHGIVEVEFDSQRRPAVARGTTQDVTAVRAAEHRRRESEARLAEAERMAGMGNFEWRATDGHVVWSDGMYRLYGVPPGSAPISGRDFYSRMRPEEAERARSAIARASETRGPYAIDFHMPDAHGTVRAMTARGEAYVERGALHVRGTVQDVTDMRRIALQQREIARLGQAALAGGDREALLRDTCAVVVRTLDGGDVAHVLEVHDDLSYSFVATAGWTGETPAEPTHPEPGSLLETAIGGEAVVVSDWLTEDRFPFPPSLRAAGIRCSVVLPIAGRERPFGVLAAHATAPWRIGGADVDYLGALAGLVATAVERFRAGEEIAELAALRGRLVAENLDAEDRARRRISEELHDGALQDLLAARQDLVEAAGTGEDRAELLGFARDGVERAVKRLREAVHALHPVVLQHGGLAAALQAAADQAARQGGFRPEVEVDEQAVGTRDELLLSLARELLTNAAKHARAATVRIAVRREGATVVLEVADDGRGLDPDDVAAAPRHGHIGLASLAERVEAAGGTLDLGAAGGPGTTVRAVLPIA